jgi:hypothetical protein
LSFPPIEFGRYAVDAGRLVLGKGKQRFSSDSRKGYPHHPDAQRGDIGFHAGADQFGFPGGTLNVFPGSEKLNAADGAYPILKGEFRDLPDVPMLGIWFYQLARLVSTEEKGFYKRCVFTLTQDGEYKANYEY